MILPLRALLFWIGAAVAVVASLAILRATVRAAKDGVSARRKAVEVAYAALPALALAAVLAATWRRLDEPSSQPSGAAPVAAPSPASAVR